MQNKITQIFLFLLQMACLWGGSSAAQAVTPMVAAGQAHSCALDTSGVLTCWGLNNRGQLGDGTTTDSVTPKKIGTDFRSVAAGGHHTFAIKSDGSLWAWGSNSVGELGDGTKTDRLTPLQIGTGFKVVAASNFGDVSFAIKDNGELWAWGKNRFGQLGDGTTIESSTPKVVWEGPVRAVSTGWLHTAAIGEDGSLWTWGRNLYGQLGDGTKTDDLVGSTQRGSGFIDVSAGDTHTLAVQSDGSLWAWGANIFGQLGDDRVELASSTPIQIGTGFRAVSAGSGYSVAIKRDGTLWTWGSNFWGQLGLGYSTFVRPAGVSTGSWIGASVDAWTPQQIGIDFTSANSSYFHTVALKNDGTVWAWGPNGSGELGDGTLADRVAPVLTTNETANDPLDLIPEVPNNIPAGNIPPYWSKVTKAADVSTAITYNNDDLNKEGSVYVVAYLDPASPLLAGGSAMPRAVKAAAGTSTLVPAVLTRSGWKQMNSAAPTEPLYSGPLIPSKNTFAMYEASKFNQENDKGLFCVAYAGGSANSAKGLIRSVVSGREADSSQCPPVMVGISTTMSECFFNWAERSFPQYFAPAAAASATATPYFYRYYSGTGNYLATNSEDSHVWALGKATSGNLLDLGLLTNFTGAAGCQ